MKKIKKIFKFFKRINSAKDLEPAFFTKDIFKKKKFKIGEYTYGAPLILFENEDSNLFIGKFCSIANGVTIFLGGNHRIDWVTTYPFNKLPEYFPEARGIVGHPATKGDVRIGNDVWIGRGVIIMSGVTIGDGAVIAAGSVVSKNIGDYELWGGNPAKFIKKRFSDTEIENFKRIRWWDWEITKIKKYLNYLCSNNF